MEEENKKNLESEKSQEKNVENSGIAKLKKIGLQEVSNKTFINLENLTLLLDKDFSKLNKTKAMGFIQILQREFDVDLNELKNEYLAFNNSNIKKVEIIPAETPQNLYEEEEPKKFLPYILLALGALLGAYLFFNDSNSPKNVNFVDSNVVKNDAITEEAKESLLAVDESYEEEVNESDEVDLNKVVEEMFKKHQDDNETIGDIDVNTSLVSDKNESALLVAPKEETIDIEEDTTLENIENERKVTDPVMTPVKEVKDVREVKELKEVKEVKKPKKIENHNRGGLFIKPIQKAWVGTIFLDTMKKKDYLITRDLQLDGRKDQIILIGHKNFKIFNNKLEQGFKSKKMVRFLYKDGELREISKSEYLEHAGDIRW